MPSRKKIDQLPAQSVMSVVLDGLIVIDSQGIIQSFNQAAESIFQFQAEEVLGNNVSMLMAQPYRNAHDGYLSRYLETGQKGIIGVGREVVAMRKDGTEFPMELGVSEMLIDNERFFIGTIRDISERRAAENEINAYIERLQRSNEELDEFAYIASHDLKEPLRGLSNNAEFLYEDYQQLFDDDGKRRLDRIQYLCRRMENLVDDLLYYSRLGRQDLAYHTVSISELVDDIEQTLVGTLIDDTVNVVLEGVIPDIYCDVTRMREVLRNLITNAIKYNDKPLKEIRVGCLSGEEKHGDVTLYVKDNGIGIEHRFYDDVFRLFKRLNVEKDEKKGHGVGLTFVKKIIERHGGKIWLQSQVGVGTTFFFTIKQQPLNSMR